jgi:hypothetical protein
MVYCCNGLNFIYKDSLKIYEISCLSFILFLFLFENVYLYELKIKVP